MSFDMNPADEDPHGECRHEIQRLETELRALRERCERLETICVASWESIICNECARIYRGDRAGWYDSCALSHVVEAGEELVKAGRWERHPGGYGRRQFYRPVQQPTASPTVEQERGTR